MAENANVKFEQAARQHSEGSFVSELWGFIAHNKKWWMIPILVTLLVFGVLLFLSGTGIAPFIYTLF